MKNVLKDNKKIKGWRFWIMLFYLCETSRSKDIAPLHPFYPSVYSWIRKKVWRSGRVLECKPEDIGSCPGDVTFQTIQFDTCQILSKKFDIYSKTVFRDAENIFRHQAELVLRHPMLVSNYFVNFFYSVKLPDSIVLLTCFVVQGFQDGCH